jgi:hypothetical protein
MRFHGLTVDYDAAAADVAALADRFEWPITEVIVAEVLHAYGVNLV